MTLKTRHWHVLGFHSLLNIKLSKTLARWQWQAWRLNLSQWTLRMPRSDLYHHNWVWQRRQSGPYSSPVNHPSEEPGNAILVKIPLLYPSVGFTHSIFYIYASSIYTYTTFNITISVFLLNPYIWCNSFSKDINKLDLYFDYFYLL